jgi:hypothetical protein
MNNLVIKALDYSILYSNKNIEKVKMSKSPLNYNHKYTNIGGYNYHYVDEGNEDGELLIFVHGWPQVV